MCARALDTIAICIFKFSFFFWSLSRASRSFWPISARRECGEVVGWLAGRPSLVCLSLSLSRLALLVPLLPPL